ncbi:hypothetical protein [Streptomyces sp. Da 82-17]|uniref:hypothetical protein n=1 Tax=Streptomyces sp. Da 82-17 TaxID=3377116 RepID=UPI0038D49B6C
MAALLALTDSPPRTGTSRTATSRTATSRTALPAVHTGAGLRDRGHQAHALALCDLPRRATALRGRSGRVARPAR